MALMTLQGKETSVSVLVIRQSETYGGVLEGGISLLNNERLLMRAIEKAKHLYPDFPIAMFRPEEAGKVQALPPVQCISLLEPIPAIDDDKGESIRLVLVHFEQDIYIHFSETTRQRIADTLTFSLGSSPGQSHVQHRTTC